MQRREMRVRQLDGNGAMPGAMQLRLYLLCQCGGQLVEGLYRTPQQDGVQGFCILHNRYLFRFWFKWICNRILRKKRLQLCEI